MKYIVTLNSKKYEIKVEKVPDYQPLSREQTAAPKPTPASVSVSTATPAPVSASASTSTVVGETKVVSPASGSIYDILVAEGQTVTTGQALLVLEAMKMENEIVAPVDGTVTSVLVKKGDVVDTESILIIIK